MTLLIICVTVVVATAMVCDTITNVARSMYKSDKSCYHEGKGDEK